MKVNLGTYLKQVREERGFGVRQVSRLSGDRGSGHGLSPSLIVQIEKGKIKRPGILKLASLAEIYEIDLAHLTALLGRDAGSLVSEKEAKDLKEELESVRRIVNKIEELKDIYSPEGFERDRSRYKRLYDDLLDVVEKANLLLVPGSDTQPPIPFRFAQRLLSETTLEGETRRKILRLLLTLKGWDLEDAAAAFIAAAPRAVRSAVLRDSLSQMMLPIPKEKLESVEYIEISNVRTDPAGRVSYDQKKSMVRQKRPPNR